MLILFYNGDGSPEMGRQYTGPGRWFWEQNSLSLYDGEFRYVEGDEATYHTGFGIFTTYCVEAVDADMALCRYLRHGKH